MGIAPQTGNMAGENVLSTVQKKERKEKAEKEAVFAELFKKKMNRNQHELMSEFETKSGLYV